MLEYFANHRLLFAILVSFGIGGVGSLLLILFGLSPAMPLFWLVGGVVGFSLTSNL